MGGRAVGRNEARFSSEAGVRAGTRGRITEEGRTEGSVKAKIQRKRVESV